MTWASVPSATCTSTNMPGRSSPRGFRNVAWTCTLRVASSTCELMAVIVPTDRVSRMLSAATRTWAPTLSEATSCCGTEKFT